MKIAWFSPLPPQKTGISEYSELILKYLKNYAQVDLWVDSFQPQQDFYISFRVFDYVRQPALFPLLKTYDVIVYNMGNNAEFHAGIYEVMQRYPGIIILHDYVLHHFFAGYWLDKKEKPELYFQIIREQYGALTEELARKCFQSGKPLWETDRVFDYPLCENIAKQAKGLIVHSEFVKKLILPYVKGKIIKINHPLFPAPKENSNVTRKSFDLPEDKVIIASLGFLSPPKRLDKVLKVIAQNDILRESSFILIIGEEVIPNYSLRLKDYIKSLGLSEKVKFVGYQPIEVIYEYLACADIYVNLRFPTTGETSGSLIRMMSLGKPTIVSNIGWYSELPDECVLKVNPYNEEPELTSGLERLVKDITLREHIGQAAETYISQQHNPKFFIKELLRFLDEIDKENDYIYNKLVDSITDVLMVLDQGDKSLITSLSHQMVWLKPDV